MAQRPGGELATRPLHFIWICDCSGSMSVAGKIEALNNAIRSAVPHMRQVAEANPNARVLMRALRFSNGAAWHVADAIPLEHFQWEDLGADPLLRSPAETDIVFLMDTSGSMGGEIKAVRRSCVSFADRVSQTGAGVRLGLVGFSIGGFRGNERKRPALVHDLSRYTIGIWPLTSPAEFRSGIQSLTLRMFGGEGCYLADRDTVDIFPRIVRAFGEKTSATRILVIVSDQMGGTDGLEDIVSHLRRGAVTAYVLGVPDRSRAHESMATMTGGRFWDILASRGTQDFGVILESVGTVIGRELTKRRDDGSLAPGTSMGAALEVVADQLRMPPMPARALPPVLVLVSDGQANDDFQKGLHALVNEPWGRKAVRMAIAIGRDADLGVLQRFIGHPDIKPLQANNPEALMTYIRWASTTALKVASSPASQVRGSQGSYTGAIPSSRYDPDAYRFAKEEVW